MKKYTLTVCAILAGAGFLFASAESTLAFYQKQAIQQTKTAKQDKALALALAWDTAQWIQAHPDDAELKAALMLLAQLQQRAGRPAQALVTWYQIRFYFPAQQDVAQLSVQVEEIMDSLNRRQKAKALQLLTFDSSSLLAGPARQEALLSELVKYDLAHLYEPVSALFENYFTRYPQAKQLDKMTLLYGDWHRQNGNYYGAIVAYKKVYELFANTPYKAASLRMMADVYAADLKEYEMALSLYDQVLKQYPDSLEIGVVYKHIAVMEENRRNYDEALVYYDKAIADLGAKPISYDAWQGKADVLGKVKNYQAQYDTLLQAADAFAKDEQKYMDFMTQAAETARRRLKNLSLEATALEKALAAYPQNPRVPQMLYEAAFTYEKQESFTQAKETYQRLIIQHPTDKWATKAQARLNKLEK